MKLGDLVIGAALLAGVVCYGQLGPPGGRAGRPFGAAGFGQHPGKAVTGEPYSADVSNTVVQTLSDGNTIQCTMNGQVARDALGRTYSQETITGGFFGQAGTTTMIFISDPVNGYAYVLNPATKVATRRALRQPNSTGSTGRVPGAHTAGERPNTTVADLGTQVVNGVSAQGKMTTHTVPAGTMGNAQPIVANSETWYSPDLQVVVASKRSDARLGTSTYALTNIQRAAPNAALFEVPSGYTIKDAPAGRGFGGPHGSTAQ